MFEFAAVRLLSIVVSLLRLMRKSLDLLSAIADDEKGSESFLTKIATPLQISASEYFFTATRFSLDVREIKKNATHTL